MAFLFLQKKLSQSTVSFISVPWKTPRILAHHGGAVLGLCAILMLWFGILYHLDEEWEQTEHNAIQTGENLARSFDEHITRTVRTVDDTLLLIRSTYAKDPRQFDISPWAQTRSPSDLTFQVAIINKNGFLETSSLTSAAPAKPLDLSDREHFRVHLNSTDDTLFISKPVLGRASGKWSVQLTRKILDSQQNLLGVVVISLDPYYLANFYSSIDVGAKGNVTLVGTDGIVRAQSGLEESEIGRSIADRQLFRNYAFNPEGYFYAIDSDGIERLSSYRKVRSLPLIVSVGQFRQDIFESYYANRQSYFFGGAVLTIILLWVSRQVVQRQIGLQDAREILYKNEIQYRSVLNSLNEIIFQIDLDKRWIFLNAAWTSITGRLVEDTIGKPILSYVQADDIPVIETAIDHALKGIEKYARIEVRFFAADNSSRWLELNAQPTVDDSKSVTGVSGTLTDVTERHVARAALSSTEARALRKTEELEATLENISQGIMMVDPSGEVAVMNRRVVELLDLPVEFITRRIRFADILEYQWKEGEFGKDGDALDSDLHKFIRSGGISNTLQAYERQRPNGTILEIRSVPMAGGGIVRTYTDITAHKNAEITLAQARDAAEAASSARSQFLATMSHEIRTPLNGVVGMAGLLMDSGLNPQQLHFATTLHESAEHLLDIINDVLDFSKLDADRLTLEVIPFDIENLLQSVVEILAARAHGKNLEIAFIISPEVPKTVMGDPGRLRQILLNLAGNGIKFTESGGIVIDVGTIGDTKGDKCDITFSVKDTGIGIPPEAVSSLFKEFAQLDSSISRRFGGTGLGLAITSKLVTLMNGTIEVESEPEVGSTFRCTIPLTRIAQKLEHSSEIARLDGLKILIAEDNVVSRDLIEREIQQFGAVSIGTSCEQFAITEEFRKAKLDGQLFDILILGHAHGGNIAYGIASFLRDTEYGKVKIVRLRRSTELNTEDPSNSVFDMTINIPAAPSLFLKNLAILVGRVDEDKGKLVNSGTTQSASSNLAQHNRKVLVAEDNRTNQIVVTKILQKLGYTVDIVENGKLAVEAVQKAAYDIVFMDVMMPVMDGLSAARAIRTLPAPTGKIKIIALTASAFKQDQERCHAAGMDGFLTKPINRTQLADVLNHHFPVSTNQNNAVPIFSAFTETDFDPASFGVLAEDFGPGEIRDLLSDFLAETENRMNQLRTLAREKTWDVMAREAHSTRSSAATFGFSRLSSIARALEIDGPEMPIDKLNSLIDEAEMALSLGRARAFNLLSSNKFL